MSTQLSGLSSVADPMRLLEDLRRTAVEQLGSVPGGLYRPIEEQLHDALRNGAPGAHRRDLMTVLALRQRGASYVMRYRELIARSFEDFRGRFSLSRPGLPLGLVRESELDFHLAGQRLAESIGRQYQRPLELLDLRFEALAKSLGAPTTSNPVGATRLAGAFLQTFRDAEVSDTLQPLLFRQYDQELGKVLGGLYGRLNAQLAAAGFHADGRRDASTVSVPVSAPAAVQASAAPRDGNAADLFRVSAEARVQHQRLRDTLHVWRAGRTAATNVRPDARELRLQEVTTVASLLQGEGARQFEAAFAGDGELSLAIRNHLFEGARRLGIDPEQSRLGEQQEDAIDLVGLMFESLLNSHALVAHAHRLYARLVMPYVRVALSDENLFVRADHPARRLLDALTLSCESNDGASPQDRELLQSASRVVEKVVAEYNEDLAIFELAANELQDLLQQQRRRAEIVERRSMETVHGRERLLQARLQAASALAQRLAGQPVTDTIGQFLEQHWQHHAVQVVLREGAQSAAYARAIAMADELVAIDAAAARREGGRVATRVLALEDALVECLSSSGLDEHAAGEWMATVASALGFPDRPRAVRPAPALQLADDGDDTRLLQVVGGNAGLDFDPAVADRMRSLAQGSWLRLVDEHGEEGSVKVAWVSPLTSRLLLVNRRGVRKLVASPEQLAALSKAGSLLLDAADMPFDEAMRQVRQRLDQVARAA